MDTGWAAMPYVAWSETCDTLHAHTQVLGKIAAVLASPEPQLQHAALRLTARGWETLLLPAADGSGGIVVALDLHVHEAVVGHTVGHTERVPLTPDRPVGDVTREVVAAAQDLAGGFAFDPTPQEVLWTAPLDEDYEHARYDPEQVGAYFDAATRAALVLAAFRAPYRGRSTPVNAWWGSFDLAVNLFSGLPAEPPASGFIARNSMDAQQFALGWWPGDHRYERPAFFAYAHPAPEGFPDLELRFGGWNPQLGEYILDFEELHGAADPFATALDFGRTLFQHACIVCGWDTALAASAQGTPPPLS
jgi:hypothetical protein